MVSVSPLNRTAFSLQFSLIPSESFASIGKITYLQHSITFQGLLPFHNRLFHLRLQLHGPLFAKNVICTEETDKQLLMAIMAQFDYKYDSAIVAAKVGPGLSTFVYNPLSNVH